MDSNITDAELAWFTSPQQSPHQDSFCNKLRMVIKSSVLAVVFTLCRPWFEDAADVLSCPCCAVDTVAVMTTWHFATPAMLPARNDMASLLCVLRHA